MAEVKFIDHKGKQIFLMDFSNSKIEDVVRAINEAKKIIAIQPPLSVLGLVDVSRSSFNKELADALKDFSEHNKPFMRMTAVVGVDGIKKVVYLGVLAFTKRKNLLLKDTVEEAKDWLITQ